MKRQLHFWYNQTCRQSESWNLKYLGNFSSSFASAAWTSGGYMQHPPSTPEEIPAPRGTWGRKSWSWHTISYSEKSSHEHLFLINVFICSLPRSRVSAKESLVASGRLWLSPESSRAADGCHAVSFLYYINQDTEASLHVYSRTHVHAFSVFKLFFNCTKIPTENMNPFEYRVSLCIIKTTGLKEFISLYQSQGVREW